MKNWQLAQPITDEFKNRFPQINGLVLQLLFNRGLDVEEKIDEFLNLNYSQDLPDPFLFNDMEKAVERIFRAIKNKEKIIAYGDYDADGVTGSVVLMKTLEFLSNNLPIPHPRWDFVEGDPVRSERLLDLISVYIPHREKEGYGLNKDSVKKLRDEGVKLIITTDCGISNLKEVELANELGIDVIITDHHHAPENLPPGLALINPKIQGSRYPFEELAGVGVTFKLCQGLLTKSNIDSKKKEAFEKWLLDLVAIGTITDCCPLIGENRVIVKYGLIVLNKTQRLGLRKLIVSAGYDFNGKTKLSAYNIGFQIGPRINSAGRMDHATVAFELLMTDNPQEAEKLSASLNATNQQRQAETENIFKEAKKQALAQKDDYLICAIGNEWPVGIIGLVAGKIAEEFGRPAIAMSERRYEIIGSCRSIPQFDIIESMSATSELFARFGGHSQAAGFTLKNKEILAEFQAKLKNLAKEKLKNIDLTEVLNIESEIKFSDVNWELFESLEQFEPFGDANPEPIFLIKKVEAVEVRGVGVGEKHLRLRVKQNNKFINVIGFRFGNTDDGAENWCEKLKVGDLVDLVVCISVNEWNGNRELQLKLVDIRMATD